MMPFRIVFRGRVGLAVAPREKQRQEKHRHDDDEHEDRRYDDQISLLRRDIAGGRHDDQVAPGKRQGR
ncbi:hypothetical protein D3C72_1769460 [compost metagenome]